MALSRKPDINQLDNFVQMMSLGCPRLLPSRLKKNVFVQCSWASTKRAKLCSPWTLNLFIIERVLESCVLEGPLRARNFADLCIS